MRRRLTPILPNSIANMLRQVKNETLEPVASFDESNDSFCRNQAVKRIVWWLLVTKNLQVWAVFSQYMENLIRNAILRFALVPRSVLDLYSNCVQHFETGTHNLEKLAGEALWVRSPPDLWYNSICVKLGKIAGSRESSFFIEWNGIGIWEGIAESFQQRTCLGNAIEYFSVERSIDLWWEIQPLEAPELWSLEKFQETFHARDAASTGALPKSTFQLRPQYGIPRGSY
jgi:hypothetical protein